MPQGLPTAPPRACVGHFGTRWNGGPFVPAASSAAQQLPRGGARTRPPEGGWRTSATYGRARRSPPIGWRDVNRYGRTPRGPQGATRPGIRPGGWAGPAPGSQGGGVGGGGGGGTPTPLEDAPGWVPYQVASTRTELCAPALGARAPRWKDRLQLSPY